MNYEALAGFLYAAYYRQLLAEGIEVSPHPQCWEDVAPAEHSAWIEVARSACSLTESAPSPVVSYVSQIPVRPEPKP